MQDKKNEYISWETTREQEEREAREKEELARLVGAVEGLARTKDGLHFLAWIIGITGFLQDVPATTEGLMAYQQGRRSVGRPLFDLIKKARCVEAVCQEDING